MDLDSCVEQALSHLAENTRVNFARHPLETLGAELRLTVTAVEGLNKSRDDGGSCDGVSFLTDDVLLYAPTHNSRRENFTLAHELGHWLVDKQASIYDWLADRDEPGLLLETVCDRIAQRLLLPGTAASAVVGAGPIRAHHVFDLYAATRASRPVCAIALTQHLPGLGAIAIIDRSSGTVTHASIKPDPDQGWPLVTPWPGQRLGDDHPLLRLRSAPPNATRLRWRMPWGREAHFYVDALGDDRRVVAVFSDTDLWGVERFHAPDAREFDTRLQLDGFCCATRFTRRGYPCPDCAQPFCPRCELCRCGRDAQRAETCRGCYLQFQPHLVKDGLCEECQD